MSFSYSTSLSTTKDQIRFLTADTVSASAVFQDEEISGILNNIEPNVFYAAALMIRQRMAAFVTKAIRYRVGATGGTSALEIDRTGLIKNFSLLADKYEAKALSQLDEVFDRFAFDIDTYGRNRSEYQGVVDSLNTAEDGLGVTPDFA